jgi:hypothetical protein
MNPALTEPTTLILLCIVAGFILGLHITLFGLLRGDARVRAEASKWMAAADAGRAPRRAHDAQMAELHQAVQNLKASSKPPENPPHD